MDTTAFVDSLVARVSACLASEPAVIAGYLFGSAAAGRLTQESDVDVAVYFEPRAHVGEVPVLELEEEDARYAEEDRLSGALERALGRPVDLVVLNRAPATLAASVMLGGSACLIRDDAHMRRFARAVTIVAEDFRNFTREFAEIRERSRSLSEIERSRLVRILDFLSTELTDSADFSGIDRSAYFRDRTLRRNVERWVENVVNASIDVAKIVLASQGLPMPQTYRETLAGLSGVGGFETIADELASFSRVRNLLAHEYLDARYPEIHRIAGRAASLYGELVKRTQAWISRQ